jgi:hypothetical protein
MANIFHNSLLTIAAAAASSPTEKIFCERTCHRSRPFLLEPRMPYKHRLEFGPGPLCVFGDEAKNESRRRPPSVLDSRGWVLQEQLLSRRMLSYSNGELFWDCLSMSASESYPNGIPRLDSDMMDRDILVFKEYLNQKAKIVLKAQINRLYISWVRILENYTERKFTMKKRQIRGSPRHWEGT